jgi:hypothetical protein
LAFKKDLLGRCGWVRKCGTVVTGPLRIMRPSYFQRERGTWVVSTETAKAANAEFPGSLNHSISIPIYLNEIFLIVYISEVKHFTTIWTPKFNL